MVKATFCTKKLRRAAANKWSVLISILAFGCTGMSEDLWECAFISNILIKPEGC